MFAIRRLAVLTLLSAGLQGAGWCAQPARAPAPEFFVAVQGDRVTARLERASLRQVLDELRRQAGVRVQFTDPSDDGTVWKTFADLPLVEALYRLLEGRSFALYYDAASAAAESAQPTLVVRILPSPAAAQVAVPAPAAPPVADSNAPAVLGRPLLNPRPPAAQNEGASVPLPAASPGTAPAVSESAPEPETPREGE